MKVLKKGEEKPPWWLGVWRCTQCDQIIQLERGDEGLGDDLMGEDMLVSIGINCSFCEVETFHRPSKRERWFNEK